MISWLLEKIHNLIHFLKLSRNFDFWFMSKKIKWDNRKSKCWNCSHFDGYYFDECTYDCKKEGTLMWGDDYICEDDNVFI
ncbi:MAG: hypothetical protein ACTSWG_10535 [Candidatus Helarchaeota archaeon]